MFSRAAKVVPPIPMLSSSAESMFYGLECHPSYRALHTLTNEMMSLSRMPAVQLHEVDGAYANERLNAFFLSIPGFGAGGFLLDHSRCQNHATHLITVAILGLVGCNVLSKLCQLTVFLSNLGYVLRLQMAVRDWLLDSLVFNPTCDLASLEPDLLVQELKQYIQTWHFSEKQLGDNHDDDDDDKKSRSTTKFERKLDAFMSMWNGTGVGPPTHNCNCGVEHGDAKHCKDRHDAATKMADVLIDLLLTSCPSPPSPNKWTKLWRPVDFVAVGVLLNCYLPNIFDIAFKSMSFSTQDNAVGDDADQDPRVVEKLQFHEVQGKRYLGAKTFLQDRTSQFAIRLLLVALEPLRFLTDSWLGNLKSLKRGGRAPLHSLFDPARSHVTAALKKVASLLVDPKGSG